MRLSPKEQTAFHRAVPRVLHRRGLASACGPPGTPSRCLPPSTWHNGPYPRADSVVSKRRASVREKNQISEWGAYRLPRSLVFENLEDFEERGSREEFLGRGTGGDAATVFVVGQSEHTKGKVLGVC